VNNRNDVDLVGGDVIDDAVRPLDQFSNLSKIIFWHMTTRKGFGGNLLGASGSYLKTANKGASRSSALPTNNINKKSFWGMVEH